VPVAPGDLIRIEVRGSVIRGYRNGELILTAEDRELTQPGQPGVVQNVAQATRFPSAGFEDWRGGNLDP